jgi:hypothetical protein
VTHEYSDSEGECSVSAVTVRASEAWVQWLRGRVREECSGYEDECSMRAEPARTSAA